MANPCSEPRALRRRLLILAGVIGLMVLCDQLSKAIIRAHLLPGEEIILLPHILSLHVWANYSGFSWWVPALPSWAGTVYRLLLLAIVLLAVPVYLYYSRYRRTSLWADLAFVNISAAMWGHLADDLFAPYTTDFIRIGDGPSANLADVCAAIGLTALVVEMVAFRRKPVKERGGLKNRLSTMYETRKQFLSFLSGELWRMLFRQSKGRG